MYPSPPQAQRVKRKEEEEDEKKKKHEEKKNLTCFIVTYGFPGTFLWLQQP